MAENQSIFPVRRSYNRFVSAQTLEDYSLRYTAEAARHLTPSQIAHTALGAISFLACEALGGAVTLKYGFTNAVAAIVAVSLLIFLTGLPIAHYATRYGVDMDLLTRGAGFGYLGSTVTSLIYASFTFILFAIEGTIMAEALRMCFGVPLGLAYALGALAILPIAALGLRSISRFQLWTQPLWLALQIAPLAWLATREPAALGAWMSFPGLSGVESNAFDLSRFGLAAAIFLSLLPQIGEQVDYLRFLPKEEKIGRWRWRLTALAAGPGWIVIGALKLIAGSWLAWQALSLGVPPERAAQPSEIYYLAFDDLLRSPSLALWVTGFFVVVCQAKINVTNAYAGSIAWSNFFSRITRNHPGRVVWLVFNVVIALALMEVGVTRFIDGLLALYANFAVAWIGALTADLVVNKPLGLSPPGIEFRRAYLFDVNPVGLGAMGLSLFVSTAMLYGLFGDTLQPLAALIGFCVAFLLAPVIAWFTGGRYYLARPAPDVPESAAPAACLICANAFEPPDMAFCTAYGGVICSLCCSLDMRCHDRCKTESRLGEQAARLFDTILPASWRRFFRTRAGRFILVLALLAVSSGLLLGAVYLQYASQATLAERATIRNTLEIVFIGLTLVFALAAYALVLAQESRRVAEEETSRQTASLRAEIEAHKQTDQALQKAKELAEAANIAKTRFVAGLNHELRTPLNAINGYAQLLERRSAEDPEAAIRAIRRNTEHITNLIDGLLDIAKIESGSIEVARDTFDIRETLDQLADMFRIQARARGVAFQFEASPNLPRFVRTDKKRLRQILINLMSNAVKFTERGHVALEVTYRSDIAEFEVSDTGVGILPSDIEAIFAPFERGRTPGVSAVPGTGLGLTITRLLTRIIGGELRVESTPGQGSRFVLRLYLTEAMAPEDAPPPRVAGYAGGRRRILVADDSPAHLDVMHQSLGALGFDVVTVTNGEDCLGEARDAPPDLVLLDIAMPRKDGWRTARELRAAFADLPIIMISADARELTERWTPDAPHDDFLVKPYEFADLADRIGTLLGLDWILVSERVSRPAGGHPAPPRFDRHDLDDLRQLVAIGHSRGVQDAFRRIAGARPELADALAPLREMAGRFEFEALGARLQELERDAD